MDNETCVAQNDAAFTISNQFDVQTVQNFSNQVSGRAEIVSLTIGKDIAIGKPLNEAEHHFYETAVKSLPVILLEFIPCYKGVIAIENGKVLEQKSKTKNGKNKVPNARRYIVLEDITSTFVKPSIMDLKMGTRQYSDTMSPDKIDRKKQRSLVTTSNDLGLRIAGIRSFNVNEACNHYHMNKMAGRRLTSHTILDAFRLFFSDGLQIRQIVILTFLEKLQQIIEEIQKVNFRLYCCSLLLVYESDTNQELKTDIRIIDFAECQTCKGDGEKYSGPDKGFLLGLNTLVAFLTILMEEKCCDTATEKKGEGSANASNY